MVLHRQLAERPVVDAAGRGLLLSGTFDGAFVKGLEWASVVGTVGRWHKLTSVNVRSTSVAVNAKGDAVVAWLEQRAKSRRLRAAVRPAGKVFGAPITLERTVDDQSEFGGTVEAEVAGDGRLLVAFAGHPFKVVAAKRRLYAWTGSVKGGFGRRRVVGPQEGTASVDATFTTDGRTVVAWGSQSGGIEAGSPWVVRTAALRRGARAFGPTQTLDPGSVEEWRHSPVIVARGPKGTATIGWGTAVDWPAFEGAVRVAMSGGNGRFGAFQEVASKGDLTALDVRSDGAAVVAWTAMVNAPGPRPGLSGHTLGAAVRLPGEPRFGSAESSGSYATRVEVPWSAPRAGLAAFNPQAGRAVMPVVGEDASGAPVLELRTRAAFAAPLGG
jgi:hypothetical protein